MAVTLNPSFGLSINTGQGDFNSWVLSLGIGLNHSNYPDNQLSGKLEMGTIPRLSFDISQKLFDNDLKKLSPHAEAVAGLTYSLGLASLLGNSRSFSWSTN
jgi:hypothetical protein